MLDNIKASKLPLRERLAVHFVYYRTNIVLRVLGPIKLTSTSHSTRVRVNKSTSSICTTYNIEESSTLSRTQKIRHGLPSAKEHKRYVYIEAYIVQNRAKCTEKR